MREGYSGLENMSLLSRAEMVVCISLGFVQTQSSNILPSSIYHPGSEQLQNVWDENDSFSGLDHLNSISLDCAATGAHNDICGPAVSGYEEAWSSCGYP